MRAKIIKLGLIVYIGAIGLLMGCSKPSDTLSTTSLTIVRVSNLVELYLPSSAGYQRSERGTRIRFVWRDNEGRDYAFVVVIFMGKGDATKFIEIGRYREGWKLKEKSLYQTLDGHRGKRLLFQKADRLTEWICLPFEHIQGGVVLYWFSTVQRYQKDRKVLDALFRQIKLLKPDTKNDDHERGKSRNVLA